MRIKLQDIIDKVSKYHYYVYDTNKTKMVSSHHNDMNSINMNKLSDLSGIKDGRIIILVKLKRIKKKEYELEKFSPLKLLGGILYGEVSTYKIDNNKAIKQSTKLKNKVYFPKKYIQKNWKDSKWLMKDLKKIAAAYIDDKILQQLFAINTINSL